MAHRGVAWRHGSVVEAELVCDRCEDGERRGRDATSLSSSQSLEHNIEVDSGRRH